MAVRPYLSWMVGMLMLFRGLETPRAGFANVDSLGLAAHCLHLDRQVVYAKTIVKPVTHLCEQVRVTDVVVMADMHRQCVDPG